MKQFVIIGLLAFSMLGVASLAQAGVTVRSPQDLEKLRSPASKKIREMKGAFQAISAATPIYDRCAAELGFVPEQVAFQKQLFYRIATAYNQAYFDAYKDRVGAPPDQATVNEYAAYVQSQQQEIVNKIAILLEDRRGCSNTQLTPFIDYVEATRAQEQPEAATPAPAAAPAAAPQATPTTPGS